MFNYIEWHCLAEQCIHKLKEQLTMTFSIPDYELNSASWGYQIPLSKPKKTSTMMRQGVGQVFSQVISEKPLPFQDALHSSFPLYHHHWASALMFAELNLSQVSNTGRGAETSWTKKIPSLQPLALYSSGKFKKFIKSQFYIWIILSIYFKMFLFIMFN